MSADRLILEPTYGILQNLTVEFIANGSDVAALLRAEEVAGAADFQIAQGDLEAGAELGEFFYRFKSAAGHRRHAALAIQQKVGISSILIAAHASSKLVQIGKAITVRLVDKDGVDVGNIQAALDDRGRQEDVAFLLDEIEHGLFQLVLVHLAVSDGDARFRHHLLNLTGNILDVVNSVMNKINLAIAV